MSDKFLNTGGSGNANLSNGTVNAYLAGLTIANMRPSMPLKTNSVNTLVSTKLDITDINNLESRLDSGLSNPFNGTLQVNDLETNDTFSLNGELQKIDNFTAAIGTDTNIGGTLKVPEIATGRVYDSTQSTWIDLDGSDVSVSANDLILNGSSVITELGAKNIADTLTTSQTVFTLDQELITKKYVDDSGGGGDAELKTQNISLIDTNSTQTLINNNLILGTDPMEILDENSIKALQSFNTVSAPETGGFSFTIPTSVLIKNVIFLVAHWGSTDITKEWKLWTQDRELKSTVILDKLNPVNGYYYTELATPIVLSAGSYRCGIILNNGDKKHNYSGASTFFNDFFTTASGVFSSPDPAPTLSYPNGGSNTPSSAFIFDILNDFNNKGTTNLEQEAVIKSAKIGYNFPNYFYSGVGNGTAIYGNPLLTGAVVYTGLSNLINLGGGGANIVGKITWTNFLNLYEAGKTINFDIKFRMAPWNADGGIILWDFGTYRFIYNNNGASLTSSFTIQSNAVDIHNVSIQIPYTSNFSEITLSLVFEVDTQTFTVSVLDNLLFTFIDTTPRIPSQLNRSLFSISGGGIGGFSNETRLYDIKVSHPSSTLPIVEITPILARVNNTLSVQSMSCDSKIECPDFRVPTTQGGIRGYADQRIVFDEINHKLQIRSEVSSVGVIELAYTDRVIGLPFDLIFAATDEVNTITTTGQKISLRVPQSFQTTKIKVSVNTIGGAGFSINIRYNGIIVQSIAQGSFLISNSVSSQSYTEDNIISCDVSNVGAGTATGLKIYLIGKTI